MGIVRRQGIQNMFLLYGGVALGYLNKVVLFAKILTQEEYGLIELLLGVSVILVEFVRLGINPVYLRFYPFFKDSGRREREFHSLAIIYPVIGLLLGMAILIGFRGPIQHLYEGNSALFNDNYFYLIPLVAFISLSEILNGMLRAMKKTVLPIAIKEVLVRGWQTVLISLYFFNYLDFFAFLNWFTVGYGIQFLGLLLYMLFLKRIRISFRIGFFRTRIFRYIFQYGLFGLLNNAANRIINRLDVAMLGILLGLEDIAIYSLAYYVGMVVSVPEKSIGSIAYPIITESVKTRDYQNISTVYKKGALSNLVLGGLFFLGIWANVDSLFQILPDKFAEGKWVIFFISMSMLVNMVTSLNTVIIVASRHFRFDLYSNLFLIGLAVLTNYLLIPVYGVTGAAIATLISYFLLNLFKFIFVLWKFKLSPFSWRIPAVLGVAVFVWGISEIVPRTGNPFIDIASRSAGILALYMGLVLGFRLFPDLNDTFLMILRKLKIKK